MKFKKYNYMLISISLLIYPAKAIQINFEAQEQENIFVVNYVNASTSQIATFEFNIIDATSVTSTKMLYISLKHK